MQISETVAKTLLTRRLVVQLFLTEGISICFFFAARSLLGQSLALRLGVLAPIALLLIPVWAFEERDYVFIVVTALLDLMFLLVIGVSIVKHYK
jgi:hypothetical protein